MEFESGSRLGHYQIERTVGRGGFATVYRALDIRFGARVAIKVLAEAMAGDPERREQFVAEARYLRIINDPDLVTVFDIGETSDGLPYFVMSHADRGNLEQRLDASNRRATYDDARAVVDFLGRSLETLHQANVIHRDVKPANILITSGSRMPARPERDVIESNGSLSLLDPGERLLLSDMGIAKDSQRSRVTRGAGSAYYAAPEQLSIVSFVDHRCDVYSATATVLEVLSQPLADLDDPLAILLDDLSSSASSSDEILAQRLTSGVATDPDNRPATISQWRSGLLAALRNV